jgi:excisionase family DNA binding protein
MSEEIYTVEQFAERLKLHPKTVLRFIREGRIRAVKVGRSYRILRSDLEAMTGVVLGQPPKSIRVTSIVDLDEVDDELARHMGRALPALRMGRETPAEPMRVDVIHDPARRQLKIVIVGAPDDTSTVLKMIQVLAER